MQVIFESCLTLAGTKQIFCSRRDTRGIRQNTANNRCGIRTRAKHADYVRGIDTAYRNEGNAPGHGSARLESFASPSLLLLPPLFAIFYAAATPPNSEMGTREWLSMGFYGFCTGC